MSAQQTQIAGLIVHSTDPVFLAVVGAHFVVGLTAVLAGLLAILSPKRKGRHVTGGRVYFWSVCGLFGSAAVLTTLRGPEDLPLLALGAGAALSAWIGRSARRGRWGNSLRAHVVGMALSYIFMLTAFYVETGEQLPLWNLLPPVLYWVIPSAIGIPLIGVVLLRHPLLSGRRA